MIFFSLVTTIIVSIVFFIKKSIRWAMLTFMSLMLVYTIGVYGVMPEVIIDKIDFKLLVGIATVIMFTVSCKYVMDKYLVNEVGLDLADLIITIFPDRRLKLFVLFFVGQLAFSNFLLINILIVYFIGKILKIDTILIMIIGMISLIINDLFDASYVVLLQDLLSTSDYSYANFISIIFLLSTMFFAFIAIFMSILFIKDDKDDDFLTIIKKDWLPYIIIIISYLVIFAISALFFDTNDSQKITSFVMLGVISLVSTKLMKHNHEFMENENKEFPFIFSILIFIINGLLILFANYALVVATIIFMIFNFLVLLKYKSYEEDNQLDVNVNSRFIFKISIIAIFIYCFTSLITNSNVNTTDVNISIFDQISTAFTTLNSPVEVFLFFFALGPLSFFIPFKELVFSTSSTDFVILVVYFSALYASFNIIIFYILHDLLGVEDNQALIAYHAVMAFTVILGLVLTIIVLIGG